MKLKQILTSFLVIFLLCTGSFVSTYAQSRSQIQKRDGEYLNLVLPVWQQANSSGFGDPANSSVTALEAFNGYLYAGTYNPINPPPGPLYDGAQIFRSVDGLTWDAVTQPGFGNTHDIAPPAILDFVEFYNQLYASTGWGNASQIWRTSNGTIWAPMDVTGFSDPDNVDITALAVYNGMIYAGVTNQKGGAQIWRSYTGDNNSWTQVGPAVQETIPASITGFTEFNGSLYAAVAFESDLPAQIWVSSGSSWEIIVNNGFGDAKTLATGGIAVFGGYLYVGAGNTADGAQLWRSLDGTSWLQVISPAGLGDTNNQQVEMVYVNQNQLYISMKNAVTGMELWRSVNGTAWERVNQDGFGDSGNSGTNLNNAAAEFGCYFYVGTANAVAGGEIWRMQEQCSYLYLPLILRLP